MTQATIVTYPGGSLSESAIITGVYNTDEGKRVVVTDVTPFHPLDPWWPDQPSDRGKIRKDSRVATVEGAVLVGVSQATSEIRIANTKGIKRSDESWVWSVGHVLGASDLVNFPLGDTCQLEVDPEYRHAISVGHTGCHIAALALNNVLEKYWSKAVAKDSFGNNNFDQEAITLSRIEEYKSIDHYRLGKSLRKAGFATEPFWRDFEALKTEITRNANEILRGINTVVVSPNRTPFHARRSWIAAHRERQLEIPCGGVHVTDPREVASIEIELERLGDPNEFAMYTQSKPTKA